MRAVGRRLARDPYRTRWNAAVGDLAGGTVVDLGALANVHAMEMPDRFLPRSHPPISAARTDEAVVFNDGRASLHESSTPPMPTPPDRCAFLPIWARS